MSKEDIIVVTISGRGDKDIWKQLDNIWQSEVLQMTKLFIPYYGQ